MFYKFEYRNHELLRILLILQLAIIKNNKRKPFCAASSLIMLRNAIGNTCFADSLEKL